MFIRLTAATTPAQAILMAYNFAGALRATGWPVEDIGYARALWIGSEYKNSAVLAYLTAGFDAGYMYEDVPAVGDVVRDVPANDATLANPLERGNVERESRAQALAS